MSVFAKLARAAKACRVPTAAKTPNFSATPLNYITPRSFHRLEFQRPKLDFGVKYPYMLPCLLSGLLGGVFINVAYADNNEASVKPHLPSESASNFTDMEETVKRERGRIEESLRNKGMKYGSYPRYSVAVNGQKITVKFRIPPESDIPQLIANLVSNIGLKVDGHNGGTEILLRAWDSAVAWQLMLNRPVKQTERAADKDPTRNINTTEGDLSILIFRSLLSKDKPEIEFIKSGSFSNSELDALVSLLELASQKQKSLDRNPGEGTVNNSSVEKIATSLESMGVRVYGLEQTESDLSNGEISWDNIVGYEQQKREIEDTILLALHSPEVYDDIARGTRHKFEPNRPRAVLFEGPPGTGKTSSARFIATQAGVPFLYVPLEVIMSKYYGESERLFGKIFSLANELPSGAILFLDEIDSLAVVRQDSTHEASRRILSLLLRQIDGFDQNKKIVIIAATNRKQDLDPAMMSRFNSIITFDLPDEQSRQKIAAYYAKHLKESELEEFAKISEDMSGRDIRDVCEQAERSWASKIIRGQAAKDGEKGCLPPFSEYVHSATTRRKALSSIADLRKNSSNKDTPSVLGIGYSYG
ncbi:hypothetical protein K2173_001343 [Erythroxylum novogranatense]|uniref:AAA+ ATPase domain-containing protein n=1 Tax=Erythroxylum novogranatense TaxID=1862640 RepID=A0AAV8T3G8_9ROSI|nr:hypothetical protein K2173_001343 [Erythroxylum novogranatense]